MASLSRARLGSLFTNFTNTLFIQAVNVQKTRQALFHCSQLIFGNEQGIKMPALSPTMTEGKIIKWLKKEGDTINPGDVLCDIETDKAVMSMETEEEGILAKILIPENTGNVKVGAMIAVMVPPGEDWKDAAIPAEEGDTVSAAARATESQAGGQAVGQAGSQSGGQAVGQAGSQSGGQANDGKPVVSGPAGATPLLMPSLSPTMSEGTIVKWLKKEGDIIAPGDVLCDIQTDKAVMSLEAEEEGILAKIVAPDDTKNIKVGTIIAVIVPEGEDWKSVTVTSAPTEGKKEISQTQFTSSGPTGTSEVRGKTFGPAVKALLSVYQLAAGLIKPSGRGNRILKEDVLQYITDNNLEKKPPKAVSAPSKADKKLPKSAPPKTKAESVHVPKYKDIELSNMRMVIAKRLLQAKQEIPHFFTTAKCDVDNMLSIKKDFKDSGFPVSLTVFLAKAVALALQMHPNVNATFINNEVRASTAVDISMAVATENGLITPVIRSAEKKTVQEISNDLKELSKKAREKKLKPEEYQGGTFTISNLGMFGVTHFKAIINPPQCAILAVGGTIESLNPDLTIKRQVILTLSSDARVLQEHEAAEFMSVVKYFVENPKLVASGVNESFTGRL